MVTQQAPNQAQGPTKNKQNTLSFIPQSPTKRRIIGVVLAAISGAFFTLRNTFVKLVPSLGTAEIVFIRAFVELFLVVPAIIADRVGTTGTEDVRFLLVIFGMASCASGAMSALAITLIPFGDAMTIIFSSPVIVMMVSHCFLKEKCGFYRIGIVILLLSGIILITKPTQIFAAKVADEVSNKVHTQVIGYLVALCGTMVLASRMILTKKLNHLHYSVLFFTESTITMMSTTIVIIFTTGFKLPDTAPEIFYSLMVGICGNLAFNLMYVAMKFETASVVSMARSLEIVLSYYMQIQWFGEKSDPISLTGAGLVVASIVIMTQEDQVKGIFNYFVGSDDCTEKELLTKQDNSHKNTPSDISKPQK